MKPAAQPSTQETVDILNSFLRGELSAVETYRQAIEKLRDDSIPELKENEACHQRRAEALEREIMNLGGVADQSSGAWGTFTKLIEAGAVLFGRSSALAALEEGEDIGLAKYQKDINKLNGATRLFVETDIITGQQRSHDRMSRVLRLGQ